MKSSIMEKIWDLKNMEDEEKMLNTFLMMSWGGILCILFIAYVGEIIKGSFNTEYFIRFLIASVIPYIVCYYRFWKNLKNLKYWIVVCYCIMYGFVLSTGHTFLVFTYIFPILTFLILYHDSTLIILAGEITTLLNIGVIFRDYREGKITLLNTRDYEIQMALIFLCFFGSYISSKLYSRIDTAKNAKEKEVRELLRKQTILEEEKKFANLDYLTKLSNRKKFDESLKRMVRVNFKPFYLISLDINGLKKCNDTLGHLAGDELIIGMSQCMTATFVEEESECFRISGDEFCILCRYSAADFEEKCKMLQKNIANWRGVYGYKLSASAGYIYVSERMEVREILRLADEQMYKQKAKYYSRKENERRS